MSEGIYIKKKNRGKFTATKKRTGKSTEELTHSKNPLTRKRAIFAQNARKWNHKKNKNESYMRTMRLSGNNLRRIVAETTARVLAEAANPQPRARIGQTGRTQNSMADEYNQSKNDMINDYNKFKNQSNQDYNQSKNQMGQGYNQGNNQAGQGYSYVQKKQINARINQKVQSGEWDEATAQKMREKCGIPVEAGNPLYTW